MYTQSAGTRTAYNHMHNIPSLFLLLGVHYIEIIHAWECFFEHFYNLFVTISKLSIHYWLLITWNHSNYILNLMYLSIDGQGRYGWSEDEAISIATPETVSPQWYTASCHTQIQVMSWCILHKERTICVAHFVRWRHRSHAQRGNEGLKFRMCFCHICGQNVHRGCISNGR